MYTRIDLFVGTESLIFLDALIKSFILGSLDFTIGKWLLGSQ